MEWELDHKESWMLKNWRFWTVVLEKTLENPLDCKEIKPVYPKGNQSWIFIGRTDMKAEAPIIWPPDAKNWLTGKDLDAGKDWIQEKGTTENEMVEWHHRLDGHEFEQPLEVGDGQGSLVCSMQSMRSQRVGHHWATELNWLIPYLNLMEPQTEMSTLGEAFCPKKLEKELTEMCECVNHPFFFYLLCFLVYQVVYMEA